MGTVVQFQASKSATQASEKALSKEDIHARLRALRRLIDLKVEDIRRMRSEYDLARQSRNIAEHRKSEIERCFACFDGVPLDQRHREFDTGMKGLQRLIADAEFHQRCSEEKVQALLVHIPAQIKSCEPFLEEYTALHDLLLKTSEFRDIPRDIDWYDLPGEFRTPLSTP